MRPRKTDVRRFRAGTAAVLAACIASIVVGCSNNQPTTRPASVRDRQERALQDPFGYSPNVDKTDISGGDIGNFDKDAFKRDIDHVFNP
jgi:dihydroorotase-like cyclic amidohydrolase